MLESARSESANRRDWSSEAIELAHRAAVAAVGVEQQALEIRRHLDIHGRRGGGHHLAQIVGAGRDRTGKDVVDVGGDHQAIDRQAHAERDIAGIDVAEIAGRHREGDFAARRAERDRGGEVIDNLRHDTRPIDGIHTREPRLIAEGMVIEHALHDRLTVVECALDRQRVDVVVLGRRHHAPLHVGNAPLRKQHEEIGARAAAERLDRSATGVARGRNHDGGALPARL